MNWVRLAQLRFCLQTLGIANKPRTDSAGCLHHVMTRGNVGAAISIDSVANVRERLRKEEALAQRVRPLKRALE